MGIVPKTFGREFRERRSLTESDDSDRMQFSFQQDELLPASRIETLSQGIFFGKVADDFSAKIERKLFCGEIVVDKEKERKGKDRPLPRMTDFGEDSKRKSILEEDRRKAAGRRNTGRARRSTSNSSSKGILKSILPSFGSDVSYLCPDNDIMDDSITSSV